MVTINMVVIIQNIKVTARTVAFSAFSQMATILLESLPSEKACLETQDSGILIATYCINEGEHNS